jgi:hypothetical protein
MPDGPPVPVFLPLVLSLPFFSFIKFILVSVMKHYTLLLVLLFSLADMKAEAQPGKTSQLFYELKQQDSIFFERAFNQCDMTYLESRITSDLRFYHDQGGFQDKNTFLENTRNNLCNGAAKKPIRKVDSNSLEVFPLYKEGELYGAIQTGVHHFYLREKGKDDIWTSVAKFSHVWLLDKGVWRLGEVLSYDHRDKIN